MNLREVLTFDNYISVSEALVRITNLLALWSMNVADLRHVLRTTATTGAGGSVRRAGEDNRRIVRASCSAIDNEGHGVILDLDQSGSIIRDLRRDGGDSSDGLACVTDNGVARRGLFRGIAKLGDAVNMLNDMHGFHARQLFRSRGVDGEKAAMRDRRVHHARIKHSRQLHVCGVFSMSHCFCRAVVAQGGFADVGESGVGSERWRFVEGDLPLLLLQSILRNAPGEAVSALGGGPAG